MNNEYNKCNGECGNACSEESIYTGYADLSSLDHEKGGIPETGKLNKNRSAMFVCNKENKDYGISLASWLSDALKAFTKDQIDTIIIDTKRRSW